MDIDDSYARLLEIALDTVHESLTHRYREGGRMENQILTFAMDGRPGQRLIVKPPDVFPGLVAEMLKRWPIVCAVGEQPALPGRRGVVVGLTLHTETAAYVGNFIVNIEAKTVTRPLLEPIPTKLLHVIGREIPRQH